jgi:opacity protein-like surface antigen
LRFPSIEEGCKADLVALDRTCSTERLATRGAVSAMLGPARRAAAADPISALRHTRRRASLKALRRPIIVLLVGLAGAPAQAAGFISPFLGFNFGGDSANCIALTNCEEKRANWGIAVGTSRGVFGFEEEIAYAPGFFGKASGVDNGVLTLMSNVMLIIPAGRVRPYGLVGLGLIRPHAKLDATSLSVDKNAIGWDIGGGINIFVTPAIGLRGDIRHIRTLEGVTLNIFSADKLDFWRASAGMTLRF